MSTADAATVAAAAAAGLVAGRAASRYTARLLAPPWPGSSPARWALARCARTPWALTPWALTPWALTLGTGLACTVMALRFGPSPVLPAFCYLAGIGVPLAVIDARCLRLPDALTLPSYPVALALLGLAALLLPGGGGHFRSALLGLAVAGAVFLIQVLLYPRGPRLGGREAVRAARPVSGLARPQRADRRPVPRVPVRRGAPALALIAARRASRKSLLPFGTVFAGRRPRRHPAQRPGRCARPLTPVGGGGPGAGGPG